ncbi:zinc finger protein 271-like isoform X1 [Thunnus maccoyii]|uniref:zinc finger protein 271-like isoform X1 n=1 Tax=Thunnus maccoyii TaxID=8240 RepID=UPI001C4D3268|nr:zinc finger protein 271-like isoform X1 [Thunnus maccoyii]
MRARLGNGSRVLLLPMITSSTEAKTQNHNCFKVKMSACCVSGCKNRHSSSSKLKFYRIPSGSRPFQANRRRLWLKVIKQANGSTEELNGNARICGAHFISGEASMDHDSPDFVPSVFTCTKPKQSPSPKKKARRRDMFYSRRKRRHRSQTANVETEETPPGADSHMDLESSVLMETTGSELSEEIQTPSTPTVSKKRETLITEAKTPQTTPSPNKTLPSLKLPAGIPKLSKMSPVVLLKPLISLSSGYQCEQCDQNFTNVSQFIKHKEQHEEEQSAPCEICGKRFASQALFTEHQCIHTDEPSFPCNMCDRSFTSSHNLKRHKLLHVRDGRKCSKCGVLFCRRHNHVLFLPQTESITESEQDSSIIESQNLMPENDLPEELEPNQTADLADDAKSSLTIIPQLSATDQTVLPTTTTPEPLPKSRKASLLASHARILTEIPLPKLIKPLHSSVPPEPQQSSNPSTSFQFKPPQPPNYPADFIQPHLPLHPQLPSSLQIFSPQCLTSALLEVKRNYKYILSKEVNVKEKKRKKQEKDHVKEKPCETPLIPPVEQSSEQEKKERTAYDLEIVL